ncbi:MAG: hypothetical protein LKF71_01085 [Oscillospiraceae bacterium]|jgi:hypothetical protein|nr:hypothetical protein [Oscillospiraceae bacterium]
MAREGYLVHQGDETIHSEKLRKEPKTPKEKWQNFWYYHKWHVLIGIAAAALVIFAITDAVTKVSPDYQIGLITSYQVPDQTIQNMEKKLQTGAKDRNGDGKVVVQVNNYAVGGDNNKTDPQVAAANVTRLMGDFTTDSDMLFICDDKGYDYIQKQDGWDKGHTKMALPESLSYQGYKWTASMRALFSDNDKKYQKHKEYWDASLKLFQNVKNAKKSSATS